MTLRQRLRFLVWFAWLDLFGAGRSRHVSLVNLGTVAALVALTVVIYGLVLGYDQLRLDRLRRNPLTLCLWVGRPATNQPLSPEELAKWRAEVSAHLSAAKALRGIYPYRTLYCDWFDQKDADRCPSFPGRTLTPGDPLLEGFPLRTGRAFESADEVGVLLTVKMLESLHVELEPPGGRWGGIPPTAPPGGDSPQMPPQLRMRVHFSQVAVPVLGILARPLPGDLHFIMTEAGLRHLFQSNQDVLCEAVRIGPLSRETAGLQDLPEEVRKWLLRNKVRWVGPEEFGNQTTWKFEPMQSQPLLKSQWQRILKGVQRQLKAEGHSLDDQLIVRMQGMGERPVDSLDLPNGHNMAGIYVRDLEDLKPAAEAVAALGLQADEDVIHQIEGVRRSTSQVLTVLTLILVVVGLLALALLFVVEDLRAQQKRGEIGMLKAMGMDGSLLAQVYATEALLLWSLGLTSGLFLGWALGRGLAARWLIESPLELPLAFRCPAALLGLVALGSGLFCLGSMVLATHPARKGSPIENLAAA